MMTHFGPFKPSDGQNFDFRKQDGGRPMHGHVSGRYRPTQSESAGDRTGTVSDADGGAAVRVHIGATWRIRLNRPCAATMRPYVKLL